MLKAGQYEDTQSSIVHDDAPDETSELRTARITSFVSFSSICSFYNAAGQVQGILSEPDHCLASTMLTMQRIACTQGDWGYPQLSCWAMAFALEGCPDVPCLGRQCSVELYDPQTARPWLHAGEKLARLVVGRAQTVLGWFVSRRAVWLTPSLRDRAVCEALPSCLERLQAQSKGRQAQSTGSSGAFVLLNLMHEEGESLALYCDTPSSLYHCLSGGACVDWHVHSWNHLWKSSAFLHVMRNPARPL